MEDKFGEDYFERGVQTGKSCYSDYHWMPELTIRMAHYLIHHLHLREGDRVLDFGCAKGFLVKALRLLGVEAYGCDISKHAIESSDGATRQWLSHMSDPKDPGIFVMRFDWIITKDVLEHLEDDALGWLLRHSHERCSRALHVVPLGNDGRYFIPDYHHDPTHIQIHPDQWWIRRFEAFGWKLGSFHYDMKGVKDNWVQAYPHGNGFFMLTK